VEGDGEIAPIRLRAVADMRVMLNGADVTGALGPPDAAGAREYGG
jgi:hypothetical protein